MSAECTYNRSCLNNYCWFSTGDHSEWLTRLLWAWHWLWCRWARGRIPSPDTFYTQALGRAARLAGENAQLQKSLVKVGILLNEAPGGAIWHLECGAYKRSGHGDSALRLLYEARAALEGKGER